MRRKKGRTRFIAGFLAPASILYGVFVLWPLVQAFWLSLYRWRGVSAQKTWLGFENFRTLLTDEAFGASFLHSLLLLAVGGLAILVLSLLVAHAVQGDGGLAKALRATFLFPQVISLVVVAILWKFIFNPEYGLLTGTLQATGLGSFTKPWLGHSSTALACVGVAFVWWAVGFYIMLFAAGIKSLPGEVMEAASLDGVSGFGRFWSVTWPMLWSVKRVAFVYLVINVSNVFALVYLMTQGGPDRATEVPLTYLYEQAFKNSEFGYATALGVVVFALTMAAGVALLTATRRSPMEARS